MKILNKPNLIKTGKGSVLQTIQITGSAGDIMPHNTHDKEAVLTIIKGEASLDTPEISCIMHQGSSSILGAGKEHKLTVLSDFMAVMVMEKKSQIEFI